MSTWNEQELRLKEIMSSVNHTTEPQIRHRMELVDTWAPRLGDRILEIGCGQGDTTVVLAQAVGPSGRIVAVDTAGPEYGAPTTIGQAHAFTKSSQLGPRIEYRLGFDLLDPEVSFLENEFDLVVLSKASWNMSSAAVLGSLFARIRPWATSLGYAEWDPRPQSLEQVPHLVAVLLHLHFRTVWSASPRDSISSLVLPDQARIMAEDAGWRIVEETINTETSERLEDGKMDEITTAFWLAQRLKEFEGDNPSWYAREVIESEVNFLAMLSDLDRPGFRRRQPARSKGEPPIKVENKSLPTYVFRAVQAQGLDKC